MLPDSPAARAPGAHGRIVRMSRFRDEARALRAEDAFDVDALHRWLAEQVPGLGREPL